MFNSKCKKPSSDIHTHTKAPNTTAFSGTIHPPCLCAGSRERRGHTMYVFSAAQWAGLWGVKQTQLHLWAGDSLWAHWNSCYNSLCQQNKNKLSTDSDADCDVITDLPLTQLMFNSPLIWKCFFWCVSFQTSPAVGRRVGGGASAVASYEASTCTPETSSHRDG